MDAGPLSDRIVAAFGGMSAQLRAAARFVLDRPRDVALLSMREQARQAGVQPATMTRLAKQLGLQGYEDVRSLYAAAVREGDLGFAGKAGAQVASQKLKGDKALAAEMLNAVGSQIARLGSADGLERLVAAAQCLARARRIYCLGLRSCHPFAWHLHYVLSLIGERAVLLDGMAETGADRLANAGEADSLAVASVFPYARRSVELAEYAAGRGIAVVAVTDSAVSPLARIARHAVLVPTDSPSFFHAMSPVFIVAEILGAIVAGQGGEDALGALRRTDQHLAALDTYLTPRQLKRSS